MINVHYETPFVLKNIEEHKKWVNVVCESESYYVGDVNYIFCDDDFLLSLNQQYLQHDTLTDIITFDYTTGKQLSGDIFISVERLKENSMIFNVGFDVELLRVMAHGLLHLMGYKDKLPNEQEEMRLKEEEKIKLFHVEH